MTKPLVIIGSDRLHSNTRRAVLSIFSENGAEIIDLASYRILHYDYDAEASDDFLKLADKLKASPIIVFATPAYWYAMSGRLKVFFDRLTDLISRHKVIGRALKSKKTALIATGTDPELPRGFEVPIELTSKYFEMTYCGAVYVQFKSDEIVTDASLLKETFLKTIL